MTDRSRPRKILFVIGALGEAGAERQLYELSTRIDRARFDPVVCSLNTGHPFARAFERAGVRVIELPRRGKWDFGRLARLRRVVADERPDLLHAFLPAPSRYAGLACLLLREQPVQIVAERSVGLARNAVYRPLDRFLARRTAAFTANAQAVAAYVAEMLDGIPMRIEIVPNGIDPARFAPTAPRDALRERFGWRPEDVVVLAVGRLVVEKGYPYLLEAFERVAASRPHLRLAIAGDGPLEGQLLERVRSRSLRAELLGRRTDVPDLLRAADVFALASLTEGFPNVLGEALLAERPVAVTSAGGIPEVATDRVHGRVVPPGDAAALAGALAELLDDPEQAARWARAGAERVRGEFSVDAMVARSERLYAEVLAGRGRA